MVRSEGNAVITHTGFPVAKSANDFKSGLLGKVKGAPIAAVDLIKETKPYEGGNDEFWWLHQLDITDKHKLLVPVGMVHTENIFDIDNAMTANPHLLSSFGIRQILLSPMPEEIVVPEHPFPLKDGAEIYRFPAHLRNEPKAQMYKDMQFRFEVALGEVEVVEGQPLIPTLFQLSKFIESFVELFPPLFSQAGTP